MYDAGGISLKPSDAMHAAMKLDMSGAAAILGAMSTLRDLGCQATVTGYLMCTDNMPSGTALRLGDILTIRGGTTVEVVNADAEGRLVLADGIVLSTEDKADAIVTIATLTGAAMRALGTALAPCSATTPVCSTRCRPPPRRPTSGSGSCRSNGATGPSSTPPSPTSRTWAARTRAPSRPALFLDEFVAGLPFAHLDICGPMMVERDELWRSTGATGFGTRLLVELALASAPAA